MASAEGPSRGLLRDCEIFGNLRIAFVWSSSPRRGRHQAAGRAGHRDTCLQSRRTLGAGWTPAQQRAVQHPGHHIVRVILVIPVPAVVVVTLEACSGSPADADKDCMKHGPTINHDYTFSPQIPVHYPAHINTYRQCRIRIQIRNVDTSIIPPSVWWLLWPRRSPSLYLPASSQQHCAVIKPLSSLSSGWRQGAIS